MNLRSRLTRYRFALIILLVALALSAVAFARTAVVVRQRQREAFVQASNVAVRTMEWYFEKLQTLVRGVAGLFVTEQIPDVRRLNHYLETIHIRDRDVHEGMLDLGIVLRLQAVETNAFSKLIREHGFPQYSPAF